MVIGTLNEGALHAQLKAWYAQPGDVAEQPVGPYVVDLVRDGLLVEIQTGGFAPLRKKLASLLLTHRVRVVAPVAETRRIVRLSDDGEILSSRRSPKHGQVLDVFERLVSIPALLAHDGFELEVAVTHEEEVRVFRAGKAWRRRGWVVAGRSLVDVVDTVTIASPRDVLALLPQPLPPAFDTADLATAAGVDRRLAQCITYCLRRCGVLETHGKRGRSLLYALA